MQTSRSILHVLSRSTMKKNNEIPNVLLLISSVTTDTQAYGIIQNHIRLNSSLNIVRCISGEKSVKIYSHLYTSETRLLCTKHAVPIKIIPKNGVAFHTTISVCGGYWNMSRGHRSYLRILPLSDQHKNRDFIRMKNWWMENIAGKWFPHFALVVSPVIYCRAALSGIYPNKRSWQDVSIFLQFYRKIVAEWPERYTSMSKVIMRDTVSHVSDPLCLIWKKIHPEIRELQSGQQCPLRCAGYNNPALALS